MISNYDSESIGNNHMLPTKSKVKKNRVLSIDGGGIKGVLPLAFLATIEENANLEPIGRYFELISGTSTGGIIAAGLAFGYRANYLLDTYKNESSKIFTKQIIKNVNTNSKSTISHKIMKRYITKKLNISEELYDNIYNKIDSLNFENKSMYNPEYLSNVIDSVFKNKKVEDSDSRLLIPAWDVINNCVRIYKTAHKPFTSLSKKTIKEALMATTAAPLYFPVHVTDNNTKLIDGSIWAYDPIAIAVAEAISLWKIESIRVLSLGCSYGVSIPELEDNLSLIELLNIAPNLFFDGQSEGAKEIAKTLLNSEDTPDGGIFRISKPVPEGYFGFDDIKKIDTLIELGKGLAQERVDDENFMRNFFSDVAAPYLSKPSFPIST